MKESYPDYSLTGLEGIRKKITTKDRAILEKFFAHCKITCGDRTIKDIEARLLQARDIIGKGYDAWTKEDVEKFNALLNNSKRTQWTKHSTFATFKRFVKWQYKNLAMIENLRLKRGSKFNYQRINDSTLLTAEEIEKLIRTADSLRLKAFVILLYETGARPEEIRKLKWKDIKFYDDHADINIFSPKTTQCRTIPIKEAVIHLKRWKQEYCLPNLREHFYIFPARFQNVYDPERTLTGSSLSKMFRYLGKQAGILKPVYPYMFRHSRLTSLYNQLPEQIVKKFGGHAPDSDMPAIYSHISNKNVKDAMLEKIYHVEELTAEQKHQLEKVIEDLKNKIAPLIEFQESARSVMDSIGSKLVILQKTIEQEKENSQKEIRAMINKREEDLYSFNRMSFIESKLPKEFVEQARARMKVKLRK